MLTLSAKTCDAQNRHHANAESKLPKLLRLKGLLVQVFWVTSWNASSRRKAARPAVLDSLLFLQAILPERKAVRPAVLHNLLCLQAILPVVLLSFQ